ncbi:S-layer homology domain-containing protein [Peribacillus loiseleuriae]|uniref:S-layer homology domain-containing protein n=1 Tax=Peribacillus loiseleuriae TaxID=1679170 RepID=UPI003D08C0A7
MAKVLTIAFSLDYVYGSNFTDVKKSDWSYPFITAMASNSITTGVGNGRFEPNTPINRAQFAVFMARVIEPDFRPGIQLSADEVSYTYNKDGSLSIKLNITNKYSYTVTNIRNQIAITTEDIIVAEKVFNFGSGMTLKAGESRNITLTFEPNKIKMQWISIISIFIL